MGSALGEALLANGHDVSWASEGRSAASRRRAEESGLSDAGTLADLAGADDVIISICPPHAAVDVASGLAGFQGVYVDANAISPASATSVAEIVREGGASYVDGGVIGPPPTTRGDTRLYLSGPGAEEIAALFTDSVFDARVVLGGPTQASALKMAYAAWTKGGSALMLAVTQAAERLGVENELVTEWKLSQPQAPQWADNAARQAAAKGWRWAGEMEEIAETFEAVDVPGGFHRAAAEVYRQDG